MADNEQGENGGDKKPSSLIPRIISALVLAPIVLGAVYVGGVSLSLLLALVGAIVAWEWTRLTVSSPNLTHFLFPCFVGALLPLMAGWELQSSGEMVLSFSALAAGAALAALSRQVIGPRDGWPAAALGVVYSGLPVLTIIALRAIDDFGALSLLLILLIVWGMDIGAYFAGKSIGGPKMAPRLSPNKTWAGLIGGMIAAGVIAVLVGTYFEFGTWWKLALVGGVLGAWSQVGDVVESSLKRRAGAKDASGIIPGHGGVMDRVDGLWFAIPPFWLAVDWGLVGLGPLY